MYPNQFIPKLIMDYIADELTDIDFYTALAELTTDSEDISILKDIALDEEKHSRILSDIYKKLTDISPEAVQSEPVELLPTFSENLVKALKGELSAVEKYRPLMFALNEQQLKDYLFEIISDEQNHSALINYLYSKSNSQS